MNLPVTEQENPRTANIDKVSTLEAVKLINAEDKSVAEAVEKVLPEIAEAVDKIVERLKNGGRLFYTGTGTSGRLGVLDASEIPPTFGVSYDLIQGIIAGGYDALYKATEASEDNREQGAEDLRQRGLTKNDAIVGLAASGRTPYTIGALEYAKNLGCFTACITCVPESAITEAVEIPIVAVVGAEAITGSTRMKAGTAQKMILNLISTVTMIRLGYVRGNRMTNVKSSNIKLKERSLRILMAETNLDETVAQNLMNQANDDLRVALVMNQANVDCEKALQTLNETDYVVERAVAKINRTYFYPCVACGFEVFEDAVGSHDICPICDWQDDDVQLRFPAMRGGANGKCLYECQQENLKEFPLEIKEHKGFKRHEFWRPLTIEESKKLTEGFPKTGLDYFSSIGEENPAYYWQK